MSGQSKWRSSSNLKKRKMVSFFQLNLFFNSFLETPFKMEKFKNIDSKIKN